MPRRSGVTPSVGPATAAARRATTTCEETHVAFDAIKTIPRQLAVGPLGIRVVPLAIGAVPESIPDGFEVTRRSSRYSSGKRCPGAATLEDVGSAATFAASDQARGIDGGDYHVSYGALVDQRIRRTSTSALHPIGSIASRQMPASDEEHPRRQVPPLPAPCISTAWAL
jgi:hypothetical protein